MLSFNRKESLYLLRELTLKFIAIYGENQKVYFYYSNIHNDIIFISMQKLDFLKDSRIGQIPLIQLLIYTLIEEYPQVKLAQLVLIAYRIVRHYQPKQIASILGCTSYQYDRLESGFISFDGNFSFEKLSKSLNIPKEYFISELSFSPKKCLE